MEIMEREAIDLLLAALQHHRYQTIGPTIREKVIVRKFRNFNAFASTKLGEI